MNTTPTAAVEVLLGFSPLHVMIEADTFAVMYSLGCNSVVWPYKHRLECE
jgi:hypothetical protein